MGLTRPTVVQLNTVVTEISDPISLLNRGASQANVDVGFVFNRDGGASSNIALYWSETLKTMAVAYTTSTGGNNSNIAVSSYANLTVGNVTAANISTSGNISAQFLFGNASQLTGLPATYSNVQVAAYLSTYTGTVGTSLLNSTGNVLGTSATFNSSQINGNETVTGYLNVTGNVLATLVKVGSVESTGVVYANSTTTATSTSTGALRVAGGAGIAGNVWADQVYASNNGNGKNFRIGDDVWLGDVNIADTTQLMGVQNGNKGYLRFGNVSTQTLGRDGSGPLSWTGNLNITGNILAANVNASYFVGSGDALSNINAFGNIFVSGQSPVLADNTSDTLTLAAGSGISITTDAANDSVTISTVSTSGPFATAGDFGAVTDAVTVSEDEGSVADAVTLSYDLGSIIAASGLIYPDQFVLPTYTVATLPSAATPAQMVYVSNESGGATIAFSDGTNWRRVQDRAIVS